MIRIGLTEGSFNISAGKYSYFHIAKGGKCIFSEGAILAKGTSLFVGDQGILTLGAGFSCNANFICSCGSKITFGDNCMIGWNCTVIDGDGHNVTTSKEQSKDIIVGKHVWIAAESTLLKGTVIPTGSIVAYGSIVSGDLATLSGDSLLIAGPKARSIRSGVIWEK